jgi:hypothetical protein
VSGCYDSLSYRTCAFLDCANSISLVSLYRSDAKAHKGEMSVHQSKAFKGKSSKAMSVSSKAMSVSSKAASMSHYTHGYEKSIFG